MFRACWQFQVHGILTYIGKACLVGNLVCEFSTGHSRLKSIRLPNQDFGFNLEEAINLDFPNGLDTTDGFDTIDVLDSTDVLDNFDFDSLLNTTDGGLQFGET